MKPLSLIGLLAMALCGSAHALVGPYNTGVNGAGMSLPDDAVDTHYLVGTQAAVVATSTGGYPIGPWIGDDATSAWVTTNATTNDVYNATFTYSTNFDLTGIDLSTAQLGGRWASDDVMTGARLNGQAVTFASGGLAAGFTSWTAFGITSGFAAGMNTLEVDVLNSGGGPTGVRIDFGASSFTPSVPEPETLLLGLCGLATVAVMRRKKA
ncbi:MAG: PEP-CTERM sorting domain-containing protein [Aquabacterium sp.]